MDEQLRLTDLVPRRIVVFAVLFALGVGVIVGLEFLYMQMPRLSKYAAEGKLAAIDLDGSGSLATWFSSTCLTFAGLLALLVYTVRRHRFDDYSGHYRIWFWASACWFLLSFDATASLHQSFAQVMTVVTGTKIHGDGSLWWVIPYCFLLGAVGMRLLIDMSESWLSSLALIGTAGSYVTGVACRLGLAEWLPLSALKVGDASLRQSMLENGAKLLGDLLLLTAMGLHARYVILDSEGLITRRRSRGRRWIWARRSRPAVVDTDLGPRVVQLTDTSATPVLVETTGVDSAHGVPSPMLPTTTTVVTSPSMITSGAGGRKLSKSEKKALRKRIEQMRAERERRQGW